MSAGLSLDHLLDLIPDAVILCELVPGTLEGPIAFWSKGAERTYGYAATDALGRLPRDLLKTSYDTDLERIRAELHREGAWTGIVHHTARDGRRLPVECRLVVERDEAGTPVGVLAIARDLSEEQRVAAQNASLHRMVGLSLDAIFARDATRRITFWNQGAQRMLGYTAQEAVGREPGELLRTRYPIPLEEIERIAGETGGWEGDLVQRTKDGRLLTVESRWAAEYADDGGLVGILEVNRDITARLRAEAMAERERLHAALQRSRRLESLGQLSGGIAHDFNNLLAVILNYSAFVAEDISADGVPAAGTDRAARIVADLAEIRDAAVRAGRLTRQLLTFARQDPADTTVLDVGDVVRGLQELLRRTLGEHVLLAVDLAAALPTVEADHGQIEQILVNLAVNARDAMPDGGTVTITTRLVQHDGDPPGAADALEPGAYVAIIVADTGQGMPDEVLERALEPFFTTKPKGQGTGLGLATVYGIASRSGGRVAIDSTPGHGTRVTVLLPASAEAATPVPGPVPESAGGVGTILLVEDEAALRALAERVLRRAGYHVLAAGGGEEALALAGGHAGTIDLLLTDVVMPGMLGLELARKLTGAHAGLPVVFMSGYACDASGAPHAIDPAALLEKPFTPPALLEHVRRALAARGGSQPPGSPARGASKR
ncbi:hybrid sensor histidine kinase/response regulator [Baekduia soli]|uniref:hybrid sensor histidine kinase/response regulator n=1 Tax=Baekduia soli TaxID=496014 RepID=UPI001651EF16|nr:PAS domain-containing sensor histidine kinase [Baekduia soli]